MKICMLNFIINIFNDVKTKKIFVSETQCGEAFSVNIDPKTSVSTPHLLEFYYAFFKNE